MMDDESTIKLMLAALAEMQAQRQVVEMDKQAALDSIFTPEIKQQVADIEAEFGKKVTALGANMAELEAVVKDKVLQHGMTVKGTHLQACWTKPHVSWDTWALDSYAAAHPEIEKFRKVGEPSVSIRQVGGK